MRHLISELNYERFRYLVQQNEWNPEECVFIPYGPEHLRHEKIFGHRVQDAKQLVGHFSEWEKNYLLRDQGGK